MRVLVFGASGLLGRRLSYDLAHKHDVYPVVRNQDFDDIHNINPIYMDLTELDLNKLPKNIDAIYYLAQSRNFRDFPEGACDVFDVNVKAPLLVADWAVKNKVKQFHYASTGGVYTNPDQPVKELFDIIANKTKGFYFNSKLSAELLLKNFADYFESFALLRPFFIYGPGQNEDMLIPRLIQNIKQGKEIFLDGEDGLTLNPIFVDDAAFAFVRLLNLKGNHVLNIAGNQTTSIKEICDLISRQLKIEAHFSKTGNEPGTIVADITLMIDKLTVPKVNLSEGITRTIEH